MTRHSRRGFTLLEATIALAILGIALGVLIDTQVSAMDFTRRSERIQMATLLARSKMIDTEMYLRKEGFKDGDESLEGDFSEDDAALHAFSWTSAVRRVEVDPSRACSLFTGMAGMGADAEAPPAPEAPAPAPGADAAAPASTSDSAPALSECLGGMVGGLVEPVLKELGEQMRAIVVTIKWKDGTYEDSIKFTNLVSALTLSAETTTNEAVQGAGAAAGGAGGAGGLGGLGGAGGGGAGGGGATQRNPQETPQACEARCLEAYAEQMRPAMTMACRAQCR